MVQPAPCVNHVSSGTGCVGPSLGCHLFRLKAFLFAGILIWALHESWQSQVLNPFINQLLTKCILGITSKKVLPLFPLCLECVVDGSGVAPALFPSRGSSPGCHSQNSNLLTSSSPELMRCPCQLHLRFTNLRPFSFIRGNNSSDQDGCQFWHGPLGTTLRSQTMLPSRIKREWNSQNPVKEW